MEQNLPGSLARSEASSIIALMGGNSRFLQPDQPDRDGQFLERNRFQDRTLQRLDLHQLQADRHRGGECYQLLEHRAYLKYDLSLPYPGL